MMFVARTGTSTQVYVKRVEVVQRNFQKLWKFTLIKGIIKVNVFLITELGKV
jgi:hypothetical protein